MEKACHGSVMEHPDVLDANQRHSLHSTLDANKKAVDKKQGEDMHAMETDRKGGGLSGQQAHFLARFVGLIVLALWFKLRLLSHLCINLLLAWYHSFLIASNHMGYRLRAKVRAIDAHRKEKNHMVMLGPKPKKRGFAIQPTLVKRASRMMFGCSTTFTPQ